MLSHLVFLEPLGIQQDGVVSPTLEAKRLPGDIEVRLLEHVMMFRVEGPRRTPVQQGPNHLVL